MLTTVFQKTIKLIIFNIQKILLIHSYYLFKIFLKRKSNSLDWAIGVNEVAALVHNISSGFGNATSVSFSAHPFYSYSYDYMLPAKIHLKLLQYLVRVIYGPILLGYLCQRVKGFFYIGGAGFLLSELDGREWEFQFLKDKGLRLSCFFVGSEIRSIKLMNSIAALLERDMTSTYFPLVFSQFKLDEEEKSRLMLADSADKFANHVFNAPVDQISYLKKTVHPLMYFQPKKSFIRNDEKFNNIQNIKVLHAPSSPLLKGTPLVRAAVKKLKLEGFNFDYVELIRVEHSEVLKQLSGAHIVLNEFYALTPGVFGVEAMAAHCAVMTSADANIETSLPTGANSAWMVTEYWNIYDNLRRLLNDRRLIKKYADSGFLWAEEFCTSEKNQILIKKILNS